MPLAHAASLVRWEVTPAWIRSWVGLVVRYSTAGPSRGPVRWPAWTQSSLVRWEVLSDDLRGFNHHWSVERSCRWPAWIQSSLVRCEVLSDDLRVCNHHWSVVRSCPMTCVDSIIIGPLWGPVRWPACIQSSLVRCEVMSDDLRGLNHHWSVERSCPMTCMDSIITGPLWGPVRWHAWNQSSLVRCEVVSNDLRGVNHHWSVERSCPMTCVDSIITGPLWGCGTPCTHRSLVVFVMQLLSRGIAHGENSTHLWSAVWDSCNNWLRTIPRNMRQYGWCPMCCCCFVRLSFIIIHRRTFQPPSSAIGFCPELSRRGRQICVWWAGWYPVTLLLCRRMEYSYWTMNKKTPLIEQ